MLFLLLGLALMHRLSSADESSAPWGSCTCSDPRRALKHFLSDPVLLQAMRQAQLTNEQMKAVLAADYVNHMDASAGVYILGCQKLCKTCYKWVRGIVSDEPLKEASLTVRRNLPIKKHAAIGKNGQLSSKKADALHWFLNEVEIWGERMPGCNRGGQIYVPFYVDVSEMWADYRASRGDLAFDAHGKLQILGARSFVDMIRGRGNGSQHCAHVQFTTPATFKKCGECEMYKTSIGSMRKAGLQFSSPQVQAVVVERRAHIAIVSADRGLFLYARRLFQDRSAKVFGDWKDTLLLSADKSSDVFHPERYQQTDLLTKLPQLKGLFYGIMNHSIVQNMAILSAASGIERVVRDDDAAKARRKAAKKGQTTDSTAAGPRAKKGQAKTKTNVSWKGGTVFASFLLTYISNLQRASGGKLAWRHLYLQIDGGERSFVLLCLCGYWLAIGTFDRVTIASHFVGHTHEVVDAMFSELRRALAAGGKSGTLSWVEIANIAHRTFRPDTSAKHGPVHIVEADCVFDLDKFFDGVRNPATKGLWGEKQVKQTSKPHVFEMRVRMDGIVRVPEVRSFVASSNRAEDQMLRDWVDVFKPGAKLPQPNIVPTCDFHTPFERTRTEMVRIMRSSPSGSLGLSEQQIKDYENLKLTPLAVGYFPFLIDELPLHAGPHVVATERLSLPAAAARRRSVGGEKTKRTRSEVEQDEDEFDSNAEDEEEEEEEVPESDEEDEQGKEIVQLLELGGSGRVMVQFSDGSKDTVHRDELPDQLEKEFEKLVKHRQIATRRAEKASLYATWGQTPGQKPRKPRAPKNPAPATTALATAAAAAAATAPAATAPAPAPAPLAAPVVPTKALKKGKAARRRVPKKK